MGEHNEILLIAPMWNRNGVTKEENENENGNF